MFIRYQIDKAYKELDEIEERIKHLVARRDSLLSFSDKKSQIDYQLTVKDLQRAVTARKKLADKHNRLVEELPEGMVRPYFIEDDDLSVISPELPKVDKPEEEPVESGEDVSSAVHEEDTKPQGKKKTFSSQFQKLKRQQINNKNKRQSKRRFKK